MLIFGCVEVWAVQEVYVVMVREVFHIVLWWGGMESFNGRKNKDRLSLIIFAIDIVGGNGDETKYFEYLYCN